MHSKYDNMHINGIFYALFCINNHVLLGSDCMLSLTISFSLWSLKIEAISLVKPSKKY